MESKLRDLDYEVRDLKDKHQKQEEQFQKFQESVQSSLHHIDKSVEKMVDVFKELTDLNHKVALLEKDTVYKETLMHGKLKGLEELTKKDVDNLSEAFQDITVSLNKMTWSVVAAIVSVIGSIVLKQFGVL